MMMQMQNVKPKVYLKVEPNTPWLLGAHAAAPLRLYCFSYAGGNAMGWLDWQGALAPHVEIRAVQLPGRGDRFVDTPLTDFDELIDTLADVLRADDDGRPFAFFGHSLGALVAFELARTQARLGRPLPLHVIVSGCAAPRHRPPREGLHLLDDDALIRRLRELNGTPRAVLDHRELMAVLLPTIRADMALVDDYTYRAGPPLPVPLTVFAGRADDHDTPAQVEGWSVETRAGCATHWFDGDHFFIHGARDAVLACLLAALTQPPVPVAGMAGMAAVFTPIEAA